MMASSRIDLSGTYRSVKPRQVKKVSIPVVPDKCDLNVAYNNNGSALSNSDHCSSSKSSSSGHSRCSLITSDKSPDDQSCYYQFRPTTLQPFGSDYYGYYVNSSLKCQKLLTGMEDCSIAPSVSFAATNSNPPRPTLLNTTTDASKDDIYSHRNSNGSCSSRGSSSGFESMKSVSSPSCSASAVTHSTGNTSSSHLTSSFNSPVHGMTSGTLCRRGSPQSRSSLHSSSSGGSTSLTSGGATDGFEETPCTSLIPCNAGEDVPVNVPQMLSQGVPETKILAMWLRNIGHQEFLPLFVSQGYDLSTIARMTPEDLIAIGVTDPAHRQIIHAEVRSWGLGDSWPSVVPSGNVTEWLQLIGLSEYAGIFDSQGYNSLIEIQKLNWEDFVDIGIKKLGHLKRLELAIKKMKNYRLSHNGMESDKRPVSFDPCHSCYTQGATYHQQVPPPPAPTAGLTFKKTFSPSWSRRASFEPQENSLEIRDAKPVVQVFPSHRSSLPSQAFGACDSCYKNSIANDSDDLSYMATIPRLNLHSPSRILSEVIYAQSSESDKYPLNGYTDTEESVVFDDSSACPPPPAPLACEGSIRLLRSAYNSSSELLGLKKYSEPCISLGSEQIPFANDNCGTIRNREPQRLMSVPAYSQKMPRSPLSNVFNNDIDATKRRPLVGNCDVLNDIGSMLKNLTDELDAMLLPSEVSTFDREQSPLGATAAPSTVATVKLPNGNNSGVTS